VYGPGAGFAPPCCAWFCRWFPKMGQARVPPRCRHWKRSLPVIARWVATCAVIEGAALVGARPAPASVTQITEVPSLLATACGGPGASARRCDRASLQSINDARAIDGLAPMVLPSGYERLGLVEQLVDLTDLERAARGLPAWGGPDPMLDELASRGVAAGADPDGPVGTTWASNFASGPLTILQVDYEWVYNDGPGGTNADCTAAGQRGCWEHRDNILRRWAGRVGAASRLGPGQRLVIAELMVASDGSY